MKKTKRLIVSLVSLLCFTLVIALGLGLTGAYFNARRKVGGTLAMNNGIYITIKNLDLKDSITSETTHISNIVDGRLNELSGGELVNLSKDVMQGDTVKLAVPTIAAASGSVDFYVKAKLVYYVRLLDGSGDLIGDYINLSTLYNRSGTEGNYLYAAATAGTFFTSAPAFASGWTATANDPSTYYYGSAGTLTTVTTTDGDIELFAGGAAETFEPDTYEYNKFITLTIANITGEYGGPTLYQFDGENYNEVKTGLLQMELYIEANQKDHFEGDDYTAFVQNGINATAPTIS